MSTTINKCSKKYAVLTGEILLDYQDYIKVLIEAQETPEDREEVFQDFFLFQLENLNSFNGAILVPQWIFGMWVTYRIEQRKRKSRQIKTVSFDSQRKEIDQEKFLTLPDFSDEQDTLVSVDGLFIGS